MRALFLLSRGEHVQKAVIIYVITLSCTIFY
ncbi:Phosphatidylglycerophosphatase B, partial [Haemophilus influenzae]